MKIIKNLNEFIREKKENTSISFIYNNEKYNFFEKSKKDIFIKIVEWLYSKEYKFDNNNFQRKLYSEKEVNDKVSRSNMRYDMFHNIKNTDKYVVCTFIKNFENLIIMLEDFGATDIKINQDSTEPQPQPIQNEKPMETKTVESRNKHPFGGVRETQALCILADSGAGKSYRVEKTLENEGHEYETVIPNNRVMDLLYNYNPITKAFRLNTLGKMIIDAHNNPNQLYTIIFDECHRYIEKINDHLQILSKQRNDNKRFLVSIDPYIEEEYFSMLTKTRGRLLIPDNLGIILLSSKPALVRGNSDLRNRVDFIELSEAQREEEPTMDFLLMKRKTAYPEKYQ